MSDEVERSDACNLDACTMDDSEKQGSANLCCCYALDENDTYEDPCYTPVEENCCC